MRNRTAVLRAPPPPPPIDVPEVYDPEKDDRLRHVLNLLATGAPENTILRDVQRTFAVPRAQAQADYADCRDGIRRHLDDEGAIDGVMLGALTRLQDMARRFYQLALTELPERALEAPGADPDHPETGAIFRPLTAGERASEVGARVAAATVAIKANEALTKLTGRRSARWAEKPSTTIALGSVVGLSEEDKQLLKSLGMGQ